MKVFKNARSLYRSYRAKLKDNPKLALINRIAFGILVTNILINLARGLNHEWHFFNPESRWHLFGLPVTKVIYHTVNHPIFIFFEHAWIELFSAILIYILLENRFENINRIPSAYKGRDHKELLGNFADSTIGEIRILDTSIYSFTEDYQLFRNAMLKALERRNVYIKILLLHPDTYAAEQRSKDLTIDTRNFLERMKIGLSRVHRFTNELKEEQKKRFKVQLFKNTPMMIFASWDDNANFGLLHPTNLADEGTFLVKTHTDLIKNFNKYFDTLWLEDNVVRATSKTVYLEEYLFVKIAAGSIALDNLRWGGDNESHELPKYLTSHNEIHYEALNKIAGDRQTVKIIHDNTLIHGKLRQIDSKVDKYLKEHGTEQIKRTFGREIEAFGTTIFQIESINDTQITLIDKNLVKERLDLKGYTFVSHNQFDVKISASLKEAIDQLNRCFVHDLEIDKYDRTTIGKIKERFEGFQSNPRKRLMSVHACQVKDGEIKVSLCEGESEYRCPYKIIYEKVTFGDERTRELPTLASLLNNSPEDLPRQRRLRLVEHFIESTISADIIYLLGGRTLSGVNARFKVYVHLIRNWVATGNKCSRSTLPTPQTDELDFERPEYKVIHLVQRQNVIGGINHIVIGGNEKEAIRDSLLLENPLDSVFFKKTARLGKSEFVVMNSTGEIQISTYSKDHPDGGIKEGFRDVIVVEYFKDEEIE